ncbi:hypothetical protein O6H91_13G080600 [Diphasiastrum complanatum]|uniref:Uncharacterized protein n=1 Tax=Diphasiastrum complanatum TaxID=34168 RepID=A0ACC2BWF7_DIPCM|nr:hypothetical protein O6H91_13G080600 [Diphasiastrum complanatum]
MERLIKAETGRQFLLRSLEPEDYSKGFLKLLEQLTVVGEVSKELFDERLQQLQILQDDHHVAVIEDVEAKVVVAAGSIFIEKKFVHNCSKVGHIEDVVVDQTLRGQHLGQRLIESLVEYGKSSGCYKVILDCSEENIKFYSACGFSRKEVQMAKYF